ncbi:methyl-accepting chemotaxis protein [Kineococcus glutinatus]|uniref:Methyl-accepting transducer domain-containing protein n=1 Tax=Kineococcus glutinatus TaxID=1070872 RepID=A0ABP9HSX9_9ACTN
MAVFRRAGARADERAELETYRAFVRGMTEVLEAAARGDLEARVRPAAGSAAVAELTAVQHAANRVLDVTDAYVRDAGTALAEAAHGRFHRRILRAGLTGAFRESATNIISARRALVTTAGEVEAARSSRLGLADEFESVVMTMSEHVATAATQLSASAGGLGAAASAAQSEVRQAQDTIASLTRSSEQIQEVIALINSVADQTRLLALNATIEAARAGDAGKGFAVVASEVKQLADETARATEQVTAQVASIRDASAGAAQVIAGVGSTVTEMNGLVDGIAAAVDGGGAGDGGGEGLSRMAERLRGEMSGFLTAMRS